MNLAALLVPFVVALPPGAAAPPPGAVPRAAKITVLDRELGLVAVRLPKRGVAASLRRLRAAPGVRYVERDAPVSLASEGCDVVGRDNSAKDPNWRAAIHLSTRSAAGMLIGIADSGVDDDRLAPRQAPALFLALGGPKLPRDPLGHGTAVASLLVANRPDVGVVGVVPDATLLSARIIRRGAGCSEHVLEDGLVRALGWLRKQGAQVVNVSATAQRTKPLVESLRALELSGALVVAAVGNGGAIAAPDKFPASQPGVLGVGALVPALLDAGGQEVDARPAGRSRGARGGHQDRRVELRRDDRPDRVHADRQLVRGAARDRGGRDGVGDAPRLDRRRGRERARAQRHAAARRPRAEPQLGIGPAGRAPRAADAAAARIRTSPTTGPTRRAPSARCTRARSSSRASATPATCSTSTEWTFPRAPSVQATPAQGRAGPDAARAPGHGRRTRSSASSCGRAPRPARSPCPPGARCSSSRAPAGAGPYTLALSGT